MSSDKRVPFSSSLCFEPNGSNADKAPYSLWNIVEIAIRLSSSLCANNGNANYVAIGDMFHTHTATSTITGLASAPRTKSTGIINCA
jgi:hypothetical protein